MCSKRSHRAKARTLALKAERRRKLTERTALKS
jgi:hypothetical protein